MGSIKTTVWAMEPHTQAKHVLLRNYLGAWFPIMGASSRKIMYLDGFAGPGRYANGEDGSPLVALKTFLDHKKPPSCEVLFLFLEADKDRCANLETEIKQLEAARGGFPKNVHWRADATTFGEAADAMTSSMREAKMHLVPTLALVDPFGFKGVPMAMIADLLGSPKCEIVFNFMFDSLNRWIVENKVGVHLNALFAGDGYKGAANLTGAARHRFLHDLYANQLRTVAKFKHVRWFEMENTRGKNSNSLFFATRDLTGFDRMKQAMWKVDPLGEFRFSDRDVRDPDQGTLFQREPNFAPLRTVIVNHFAGKKVDVAKINQFVIAETSFHSSQWKTNVMKPLQAEGLVTAVSGQKRVGTFPDGCVVRFT